MRAIFFDLDDTIYDRAIPFRKTYTHFFGENATLSRAAYETCRVRGVECFEASQTGEITMDEMFIYRYTKGFADVGMTISSEQALEFQSVYSQYQNKLELTNRMRTLLDYCCRHFDHTGIITNGPGQHQRDKISVLGIDRWFDPDLIFVSQECGSIKPEEKMFLMAQERTGLDPKDLYYVGDSYEADMVTPGKLGWHTLWLNRNHITPTRGMYVPEHDLPTEEALWLRLRDICS